MIDYDGPVCTLCNAQESADPSWDGFECEKQKGVCSVFTGFASSSSKTCSEDEMAVATLPAAVLACLCFRAGIDPRQGADKLKVCERAAHSEWRRTAARVAELATTSLSSKFVSIREAQEAIERHLQPSFTRPAHRA